MQRLLYALPVALFLALALYFVLALRPGRDPQILPSAMIDKPAPIFDLPALDDSGRFTRATLEGRVVAVNFFASWCVPCRAEHPLLMRLSKENAFTLYGIDYKDKPEAGRDFLAQMGDPYKRIGVDGDGRTFIDFGAYGVPETYVLDKQGHIRKRFVGPLNAQSLDQELLPLMRELNRS